jgi:hypothetical protein
MFAYHNRPLTVFTHVRDLNSSIYKTKYVNSRLLPNMAEEREENLFEL